MAFLDNSGDIVLDAVLTDLGRKRMAEGNFRITQFALGDDEIDYRIYNKNHPSGSAYYDLQILQTPVLEAFASTNAGINYGLVSFNGNLNLLYMPSMKVWDKTIQVDGVAVQRTSGSVYYISSNSTTSEALRSALNDDYGDAAGTYYYQSSDDTDTGIYVETGIDSPTADPPRSFNLENKNAFLRDQRLLDSQLDVSADGRFIRGVASPTGRWIYPTEGEPSLVVQARTIAVLAANQTGIPNYGTAVIDTITTQIAARKSDDDSASYSVINGPSGIIAPLVFQVHPDLTTARAGYALYGKTGQDLFGDGNTYDYIDTIVYVSGKTSGVTAHIPIRIVRKA